MWGGGAGAMVGEELQTAVCDISGSAEAFRPRPSPLRLTFLPSSPSPVPSPLAIPFEVGGGRGFSSVWLSSGEGLLKCKNTRAGHISSSCLLKMIPTNGRQRFEALIVAAAAGLKTSRQTRQRVPKKHQKYSKKYMYG